MLLTQPVADTAGSVIPPPVDVAVLEIYKTDVVKNDVIMDLFAVCVRC